MPEVSRFYGLRILMFPEHGGRHHLAHFHVYYQDMMASFGIDPIELIEGELPVRQRRLVEAWAELHQTELMENWKRLDEGDRPRAIRPLK